MAIKLTGSPEDVEDDKGGAVIVPENEMSEVGSLAEREVDDS